MVGKRCKRMASALIALVCVLALSVQAFSAVKVTNYTVSQLPEHAREFLESAGEGTYKLNVILDNQPDNVKEAWRTVMGSWLNDPDYYVFFSFGLSTFSVLAGPKSSFGPKSGVSGFHFFDGYYFNFFYMAANLMSYPLLRRFLLLIQARFWLRIIFIVLLILFFRILNFPLFPEVIRLYLIWIPLLSEMTLPRMSRIRRHPASQTRRVNPAYRTIRPLTHITRQARPAYPR